MASLSIFHPRRSSTTAASPALPTKTTLTLTTQTLRSHPCLDAYNISPTNPESTQRSGSRTRSRKEMAVYPSSSPPCGPVKTKATTGGHAKLHKRGGSGSSLPGPPSPFASTFSTPFATYEEPSGSVAATPKIKPYLRKMSAAKDDQGMIDLSKSAAENDRLAGLGIQDFSSKTAADVSFSRNRRQPHGRNTSTGSQISNGSGTFRPLHGQPFTHPMAKTPRPYTPPAGASYASSLNEEESNESDDVVEDEFRLGRFRRSVSISSTPQNILTPLSQSHTASDIDLAPKLSASQSNISMKSSLSSKSKRGRPRRNTDMSLLEHDPSPTSRPSFDKAFSFVSRRSEPEPQSRDELIRAARRKFEEKEATKTRKDEKRRERQRLKSDAADTTLPTLPTVTDGAAEKRRRKSSVTATAGAGRDDDEKLRAKSYEDYRPAHAATLPRYGDVPGESEKRPMQHSFETKRSINRDGNWIRFSTWFQTRMLSCGVKG